MLSFRQKHFSAGILIAASLMLAGCFRPLYAEPPIGAPGAAAPTGVGAQLRSVYIQPLKSRVGIEVRNELQFLLNNAQDPAEPTYRFDMQIIPTGVISIVDTVSGRAQVYSTGLKANYRLYKLGEKTPIKVGAAIADTSYDRTQQRFAGLRAARDAQDRSAKVVAEQIQLQLAAFFASQQP